MAKDPGISASEPVDRDQLLREKEAELARILDQHDDLVRERYHMETFVTMITGFDPAIVKHERGQDYERYAREYDLYLKHGHLLGPGRASRRRLPAAPPPHPTPAKAKKSEVVKTEQNKGSVEIIEVAPSGSNRSRKIANSLNRTDPVPITITPAKGSSRKGKSTAQTSEPLQDVEEIQPQVAASGKGGKRKAEPASSTSQRKGKRIRGQVEERSPSPLLVSTAAFRLTCPEQNVEPDLRFGESMEQYLRSYTMLEENDVDENALRHQINSTAKTRERIRLFRKHGRMLGQLEENSDSEEEGEGEKEAARTDRTSKKMTISAMKAFPEPKRLPDHNDHLLGHVTQVRNAMLVDWKVRTANSRKIARAIQIYWERELNKDDITEKMEERRRKQVMRELVKAIKAKWQLAVNVVRAKRLAAEKAEQERVGKEHLQSILERSRNLLGNPQTPDESMSEGDERVEGSDEDLDQEEEEDEDENEDEDEDEDEDEEEKEEEAENQLDAGELGTEAKSEAERIGDGGEDDEREEEEEEQEQLEAHRFGPSEREDPANTGRPRSEGGESNASRDLKGAGLSGDSQTTPLHQASSPDGNNVGESLQGSGEIPLRPRRSRVTYKAASHVGGPSEDPDISDVEFAAEDVSDEDHIMDVEMEEEEAVMDSDDEEDAGLLADADLPLEELMAKYGYGANPAAVTSNHQPGALSADENMDEVESLDDAGSMSEDDVTSNGSSDVSPQEEEANPSMRTPFLIRANLRPYQSAGLEWLAQLYREQRNAILADEMGLGKTLQTIALLAHLACDHGRWGPHLIVVPTSVILNWEMEFKKFLPGFKVLTYYGSQQERKELRKGWLAPHAFEVLITSYQIVLADQFQFKRRKWEYLILDEAHNIKNFRSQRWQTLLGFRSERRLLLTGTPLQNNLMELWSLLYFLMPQGLVDDEDNGGFANHKEFNEWFSNPMEKAIELGGTLPEEAQATVNRLHLILRPFILRRLKAEVETQLPGKFEHVIYCDLSKRQRYLYDEYMSRTSTRESLTTGGYLGVANCLMQLRKVCNHPDLFEVRAIRTSFSMDRSIAGEQEPIYTRLNRLLPVPSADSRIGHGFVISTWAPASDMATASCSRLDASDLLPSIQPAILSPHQDVRTIAGWKAFRAHHDASALADRWRRIKSINRSRCSTTPALSRELLSSVRQLGKSRWSEWAVTSTDLPGGLFQSLPGRLAQNKMALDRFAAMTPVAVANDLAGFSLPRQTKECLAGQPRSFDSLHTMAVKLQIAFPDRSLLQHDCGKLQALHTLLKDLKSGGHRVLIFTQMTRMLDILEIFLSHNGHRYSRLDGSTKVEDRLLVTERFNASSKIFALIASTRSGGVGINLTGADTVIFYDNEFNPAMDKQAMDRAHRIGQTREVHIYRLVTAHTVEENMLKKANQKRRLDDLIMQEGDFSTDYLAKADLRDMLGEDIVSTLDKNNGLSTQDEDDAANHQRIQEALAAAEDDEDAEAARAAYADVELDAPDFGVDEGQTHTLTDRDIRGQSFEEEGTPEPEAEQDREEKADDDEDEEEEEEGGAIDDYLLDYVDHEWNDYFSLWKAKRI